MKRGVLIALVVLLAGLGAWFGWRWYRDSYLPERELAADMEAQTALYRQIKPEILSRTAPEDAEPNAGESPAAPPATADPGAAAGTDAPEPDPLASLREQNPDAVGWLTIPGTMIDYPIVQAADNEDYLHKGFDGEYSYVGCPFLDCRCEPGFDGFCSIVYAHHISSRKEHMFADIYKYKYAPFLREHPGATLLCADGVRTVRFFAYLTVPSDSFVYGTGQVTREQRQSYLDALFRNANYTLGVTREELDGRRLLLLSTCTFEYENARGVLVGYIQ